MSNCLLYIIGVKLKNIKTKVYYVKPLSKIKKKTLLARIENKFPHFCWFDGNEYKHYTFSGKQKLAWHKLFLFKGNVKRFPLEKLNVKLIRIL